MRIKKEVQVVREEAVFTFLAANPDATVKEVNTSLVTVFGKTMATKKIREIRAKVKQHMADLPVAEPSVEVVPAAEIEAILPKE